MSARPNPRKSSLAALSPITTQPDQANEVVEPAQSSAPAASKSPAAKATTRATKYPPKVSFYQHPDDTARMRGALLHTLATEGSRTMSQFINQAVMAEVARLEGKYNNGEPFPAVGASELPQGRPMGA